MRAPRKAAGARLLLLACCLLAPEPAQQDELRALTNQKVAISNSQQTVKLGNSKTNNYNFQESNYSPTQWTQLVLNVGKSKNKLRKSRPPTSEEHQIKQRIMQLFELAEQELGAPARDSAHFEQLRRVLLALNPKYIATERVMRVAFANPLEQGYQPEVVPPELEASSELPAEPSEEAKTVATNVGKLIETLATQQQQQQQQQQLSRLVLSGLDETLDETLPSKLDQLHDRFQATVNWDKSFARKLFQRDDREFSPAQAAFKRLIQCLSYPLTCSPAPNKQLRRQQLASQSQLVEPSEQYDFEQLVEQPPMEFIDELLPSAQEQQQQQQQPEASEPEQIIVGQARPAQQIEADAQLASYARPQPRALAAPIQVRQRQPPSSAQPYQQQQHQPQSQQQQQQQPLRQPRYSQLHNKPQPDYAPDPYDMQDLEPINAYQQNAPGRGYGYGFEQQQQQQPVQARRASEQTFRDQKINRLQASLPPLVDDLPQRLMDRYSPNYRMDVRAIRQARQKARQLI